MGSIFRFLEDSFGITNVVVDVVVSFGVGNSTCADLLSFDDAMSLASVVVVVIVSGSDISLGSICTVIST